MTSTWWRPHCDPPRHRVEWRTPEVDDMHVLELSDRDTRILRKAVETRLREMREELRAVAEPRAHEALRADLDRLEEIGKLIGATVESERTLF
jgi:hypothetical protein